MAFVPFPFKIAIAMLMIPFMDESFETTTDVVARDGLGAMLVTALLLAPLVETAIGQWLPIWLVSLFTKKFLWVLFIPSIIFALEHIYAGFLNFFPVFPVAVALTWSFICMRSVSRWRAYWVTALIHSLHNGVALITFIVFS